MNDVQPTVVVRDLHKRYDGAHAARGVSFEIAPREVFGLLGPNGAGKTTTVECVIGLREPDEGRIEVCGIDARRRPHDVKQKIGAALQTTALQDKITAREALGLFGAFYRERAEPQELLARFALADKADAAFETLSGGQRQRLALALAFVNKPEVVFLDEPTSGLDAQSRRDLHGAIRQMKEDGHTVLVTTHDIDEAQQLCDRVAIIDRGKVIAIGAPRELMGRSSAVPSVALVTSRPLDRGWLERLPGVGDVQCDGSSARFTTASVGRTMTELAKGLETQGIDVVELHVQKASLEDVFLELTSATKRDP